MSSTNNKLFSKTAPAAAPAAPGGTIGGSKGNGGAASAEAKAIDTHVVDHNNMSKSMHSKKQLFPNKLVKTTRPPDVRTFPGEITVTKRGMLSGAVYADDLEKEEAEMRALYNNVADLTSEEIMRDEEYLKIDQSKLPLEIFDSLEYEALDKSPEFWVSTKCNARTPFFHNGTWIWRPVTVLGYNDSEKKYLVKFLPDGAEKLIQRLNLLFDLESEELFHARRKEAENFRNEAKQIMRLDHFVAQQSNSEIRAIRKESIRKIHERTIDGLTSTVPFPEQGTQLGYVLRSLTADTIQWYGRVMKNAVLLAKITNPAYFNQAAKNRYTQLKLPAIPPKAPVPYSGKLPCPEYQYTDRFNRITNVHFSSQREVLAIHRWLHDKWTQKFQFFTLLDDKVANVSLPCSLETFGKVQSDKHEIVIKNLTQDMRQKFLDHFVDLVQDVYDFFQSNVSVYKSGPLHKLIRVIDIKFAAFLRSLLQSSLTNWLDFVRKYTEVLPMKSENPDNLDGPQNPSFRKLREAETAFDFYYKPALFSVKIVIVDGKLSLEPSAEDIEVVFTQVVDKMCSVVKSLTSIDKEIMSLLTLEPRLLLNICAGDPLCRDLDQQINAVKKEVSSRIAESMVQPQLLCKFLARYSWLLDRDPDEYIESLLVTSTNADLQHVPLTTAQYAEQMDKIGKTITDLNNLSFSVENFNLVQVDVESARNTLLAKAKELFEHFSTVIAEVAREKNIAMLHEYENILVRISKKPTNERELADLRDFIESTKATVRQIKKDVEENRKLLGVLAKHGLHVSEDDIGLSWSLLEFPSRVDSSGKEMEITLEADKIRMMDKLSNQKEAYEKVLEGLSGEVKAIATLTNYSDSEKINETVIALMDSIERAKEKAADFNMREKVFGFAPTEYVQLDKFCEDMAPFVKLWNITYDFHNSQNDWLTGEFKTLEGSKIEEAVTDWWKTSYKLAKSFEEEFPQISECAMALRNETTDFRQNLPVIQSLASKALKKRHWEALSEVLGKNIDPDEDLTLQALLDLDANAHIEKIQEITVQAEKEYNLEKGMRAMQTDWKTIDFEVKAYKESGTFVVGGLDEIITLLDDHIVKTQTMRGSPYIKPIEKECRDWEFQLKYAQSLLDNIITCQRGWMYLEPIFGSEDIMRQLPTEARRFIGVDQLWRKTMGECNQDPNFMSCAEIDKRLDEKFKKANEKLEEITKGLNDYLEIKRLCFPRFFFLSNDELLEILSQTKEPRAVQPHLGKCFEGINKVKFEKDLKISAMISAEGEVVPMLTMVDPETPANKGNVEKWLLVLESVQWESLSDLTTQSVAEYLKVDRGKWILNWPAQVILGVSGLYWTVEVTDALKAGGEQHLKNCLSKLNSQLKEIVVLVRGDLSKLGRKTLGALTTVDVHNRDVVEKMVDLNIREVSDFEWMSQFRYYWEDSYRDGQGIKKGQKTLVARIVNAKCLYGYEYLGNTMRLVITALTDRCYRTMVGAIDLLYGGAPEGPAGTGKTETVKDLSKAMAIHCVVFNCSDGLDYLAMAKFFKGLAGCGSWCCFDEFNRINIEVLSVIAQQILVINQAKRENKEMFHFEGTYMKLNSNCNVFITMNPGYAGRAELPDNLKALFRPCCMMVPDYGMIGEIRLYSFGFEVARENAQKIVRVLQLSSEQLSSQKHYDYGMRAVNSILVACGNLRQLLGNDPEWTEPRIVLRSINDVNLAKFLVEDIPLFNGITSDLFPGVTLPEANYGVLAECLQHCCDEGFEVAPDNKYVLENKKEFETKTIQLYEMVLVRHGVMVVGQTGSGKTASIHNLAKAMTKACTDGQSGDLFQKTHIFTINPKSLTSGQLYGLFDENTHEFVDGILAVTFRNIARTTTSDRKWMMFDGPVDAVWIENMNTVLDDNKKLCLTSGEIIKMSDPMTMFFETEDLEQASPATVSRVGMIFCETRNIGWGAIRNIWIKTIPDNVAVLKDYLSSYFDWAFPIMSYFVVKFCKSPVNSVAQELIFSLNRMLTALFDFDEGCASDMSKVIEGCFIFSLIWTVGACVDGEGRRRFDKVLRALMSGDIASTDEYKDFIIKNPDYVPDEARKVNNPVPEAGQVYDYIFDCKTSKWVNWLEGKPVFKIDRDAKFNSIVVPTIDTIRNEWLLEKLLVKGFHVMCTGDTGTGKSVGIKNKLLSGMPSKFNSININFSAQTSANQTQDLIDAKLDKRRKGVLGPPLGMTTIVFVDDLNMPAKEIYGAQPPIEILRQWMDHRGWYDRKENEFRRLVDIQFCAAMGPPGGGRTRISKRYVRHFNVINFINFSDESLARVFQTMLDWRLAMNFPGPVKQLSSACVQATIGVFNTISKNLLPTPTKSHYTFNLRDMSKVFQGLLQGSPEVCSDKESFVRLWVHESLRVFYDRLIDEPDRLWFKDMIGKSVKEYFALDWAKIKGPNVNLVYANFGDPKSLTKPYSELANREQLQKVMEDYLEDFNQMTSKPMNLVLFTFAIEHVARISRIINQPYGNALLVGVGGSGRKSVTQLAVHIADYELFKIEITKSYAMFDWREDIKAMMNKAGVLNKPTVFMMDDTQIKKEAFLEDINGILNTGEVASLFNNEEISQLVENLSKPAMEAGINTGSQSEVLTFFVNRVRTNLHLVLCFSPIGEAFRTRLRMFPSLVNCCTIDWFSEWPEEALRNVANRFLASVELDQSVKDGVVDVCVDMQTRVVELSRKYVKAMGRYYYVTPTSYLELINTFKSLLAVNRQDVFDAKARYDNGLDKLLQTAAQVNEMQVYLEDLQPKLKEATIATDNLLVVITKDRAEADAQSKIVAADAAVCNKQAEEANALKQSCEADLAEAIPALESAEKALKSLSKADITEMKAMKKPSMAIKMTMAGICVLLTVAPDKKCKEGDPRIDPYWEPAVKECLNDPRFLQRLQTYDRDNMDPKVVTLAKTFTDDPEFDPEVVAKKGSQAAAGLAKWVHAMVKYDRVARVVAPKKAALKEAEATLTGAMADLAVKQAALKEVMDKVGALERALKEAEDKKEALKNQVLDCEAKLKRADSLIKGLGGEKIRWTENSKILGAKFENVTGDILLSSGVIAYMGAFVASYRDEAISQWAALLKAKKITSSENFTLRDTLGSPITVRSWVINKLPNDSFSIENAIMLFKSNRWPLMIDPQGQANKWVKKMEEPNGVKVIKQSQANFVRTLENAIQFGNPVLLENVPEYLDPILEPVLLKQIVKTGGVLVIRLGDATIEYDKNFKLYITTKLRNPHYPPELCVKVNLLNFMATGEGLQDQMLGRVVALEQKELELQRQHLIVEDAENQRQLKEIEDKILHLLKNAKGNILDDEVLIDTLADSKKTSNIIGEKVKIAEQTQGRISKVRMGYIPVAFQAAQLFFCIADLAGIDPMYQYSLDWYITLFELSIEQAEKTKVLEDRLKNLNDCFTFLLYKNVCRSLFEKDKLLFSFLLTAKLMLGAKTMDPAELRMFLQGSTSMDLSEKNPFPEWLKDKYWGDLLALCELPNFKLFKDQFKKNGEKWSAVAEATNPFEIVQALLGEKYDPFKQLIVLRCLRPDSVIPIIQLFVSQVMGQRFIEPPPFLIKECYGDSKCYTPLIFVLTPGAAPMTILQSFAEEMGYNNKLFAISLGQGQGPIAENAVQDAATKGTWVCLQNCHLCISWMSTLERICEEFSEDTLHPNFRLWLTSMPDPAFPAFVLQNGVKMTNEPPKGMRANLLGTFLSIDDSWFDGSKRRNEFKKMLFGLCFFHATVRERKKFGPLGWNISYVFSPPDLKISMDQLRIFLDDLRSEDAIPFAALSYLVGECNYGGRVTDDKDRRCIMNILSDFYSSSILDDAYKFSPSGVYYAPEAGTVENNREYIRTLPFNEGPEIFGLHENANITCAFSETNALLDTALSLQPRAVEGEGKSWGETLDDLARDISQKIPAMFDIEKAMILFPVRYDESMNTVLTQELIRFNRLIETVAISLRDVQKAVKGLVVMSGELEQMGNFMVIGKVPLMWSAVAYPSLKPLGSWVNDLLERLTFLADWMAAGQAPPVYWISGFFFTQAFITGTLQNFARKYKIPIDKAEYDYRVLTATEQEIAKVKKPEDGAVVKGLFIEGARWDPNEHNLGESLPRELFVLMPYIHLLPKEKSQVPIVKGVPEHYTGSTYGTAHVYMCPVYKTSFRQGTLSTTGHSTNFVMFLRIPMAERHSQKHWIKRGVAMLTQLDS